MRRNTEGAAGPDSDVNLLVVMPVRGLVGDHRLAIREALHDVLLPLDVLAAFMLVGE